MSENISQLIYHLMSFIEALKQIQYNIYNKFLIEISFGNKKRKELFIIWKIKLEFFLEKTFFSSSSFKIFSYFLVTLR